MGRKHSTPSDWESTGSVSQREVLAYAEREGKRRGIDVEIRTGGRHTCIVVDGMSNPVPTGEIRRGTLKSIVKGLAIAGLANIGLAFMWPEYGRLLAGIIRLAL